MITFKKRSRLGFPEAADPGTCGDFAECFPLDTERIAIIIGDVSGHGTAAAETAAALLKLARTAVTSREALRRALARVDDVFTRTRSPDHRRYGVSISRHCSQDAGERHPLPAGCRTLTPSDPPELMTADVGHFTKPAALYVVPFLPLRALLRPAGS